MDFLKLLIFTVATQIINNNFLGSFTLLEWSSIFLLKEFLYFFTLALNISLEKLINVQYKFY